MAITILPRAGSAGSEIAGQFGQGVSSGLQALANMKMQEYTNKQMYKQQQEAQEQQYKQAENALDSIGQGQYKPFVRIPGGMKLMESLALGGWNPQTQQTGQPVGQQPGSIQQTMNTLQPGPEQQQPGMVPGQQAQAPSPTGMQPTADLGQALRQAAMNRPEIIAANKRHEENMALKKEAMDEGKAFKNRQISNEERKSNEKFLAPERQYNKTMESIGKDAREIKEILRKHPEAYPNLIQGMTPGLLQGVTARNPYTQRLQEKVANLVVNITQGLRGVPSKWKSEKVEQAKPRLTDSPKAFAASIDDIINGVEDTEARWNWITKQQHAKTKDYPANLTSLVDLYDAAQNDPLNNPEFFNKGTIWEDDSGNRHALIIKNGKKEWKD